MSRQIPGPFNSAQVLTRSPGMVQVGEGLHRGGPPLAWMVEKIKERWQLDLPVSFFASGDLGLLKVFLKQKMKFSADARMGWGSYWIWKACSTLLDPKDEVEHASNAKKRPKGFHPAVE